MPQPAGCLLLQLLLLPSTQPPQIFGQGGAAHGPGPEEKPQSSWSLLGDAAKSGSACRAAIGQTFRLICCRWWQQDCRMMKSSAAGEHMHVCRQEQMTWWRDGALLPCRVVCKRWRLGFSLAVHSVCIKQSVWTEQWPGDLHCVPIVQVSSQFAAPNHLIHACMHQVFPHTIWYLIAGVWISGMFRSCLSMCLSLHSCRVCKCFNTVTSRWAARKFPAAAGPSILMHSALMEAH